MRKSVSSLKVVVAVLAMSVVLAIAVPVLLGRFPALRAIYAQGVVAAARDMHVVTHPFRIGHAANFAVEDGAIYSSEVPSGSAPHAARMALIDAVITANPPGPTANDNFSTPVVAALAHLGFDTLFVRRATIHLTAARLPGETLTEVSTIVTALRGGQVKLKGKFTYRGERLRFEALVNRATSEKSGGQLPVSISITGSGLRADFSGFIGLDANLDVRGEMSLAVVDGRKFVHWLGVPLAAGAGFGGLSVKGPVKWSGRSMAFERATVSIGRTEAKGTLALDMKGPRPAIDATLASERLDLTTYLSGFADANRGPATFDDVARVLRLFDADMRLSATSVIGPTGQLGRGAAAISLKGGKLLADIAELELGGSVLGGQLKLDLTTVVPHVAAKGRIRSLELSRLAIQIASRSLLQGMSSVSFDLAGTGGSLAELVRSLSGRLGISMPDGGRLGVDLQALADSVSAGQGEVRGWDKAGRGGTAFQEADIRVQLEAGVARAETVRFKSGDVAHSATGTFNFLADYMDIAVSLGEGGQGKLALSRTLRLLGSLGEPRARAEPPAREPSPPATQRGG